MDVRNFNSRTDGKDNLARVAKLRGIEFFLLSFVDVKGVLRSKLVPVGGIQQIEKDGAGFAPFATWHNYGPASADMVAVPNPRTLIQVPFSPEIGFVTCDCFIDGKPVLDNPRHVLKEQIKLAAGRSFVFKTGVEPEFFLLSDNIDVCALSAGGIADRKDTQEKPCYDTQALMRHYGVFREIVKALEDSGFDVYQVDHEDANGQFEINWHYADCLLTADRHVYFKWVVRTLAEKHGLRATFMPRPFEHLSGNGCHIHCSLWTQDGKNVFKCDDQKNSYELSCIGKCFIGGVLEKATAFCAVTNPTVNSYKRLIGMPTRSGSAWAPNRVSFSGNNRTHMIRIPAGDRFELRIADGAVNPYLLPAVVLAAGFWGMDNNIDPKLFYFPPDFNMYSFADDAPEIQGLPALAQNLLDAVRTMEADLDFKVFFGTAFLDSYLNMKKQEWNAFARHLTSWEVNHSFDC